MNKRKRIATIKHRRRRIRYEAQAKISDSYTGINTRVIRPRTRPRAVMAPLEEAVVAPPTPVKRTRRVAKQATEHPVSTSSQVTATTSGKPTRRTTKQTTETTATTTTKPTRRTTKQSNGSTSTTTDVPATATATEKRARRATKQTAESTPARKEQRPSQET